MLQFEHPLMADICALEGTSFPQAWSDEIHVTQGKINQFAKATGDRQFIHVDPKKAKQTKLGGTIAHGFFVVSLIVDHVMREFAPLKEKYPSAVFMHAGGDYKLISPVPGGEFVRCRGYVHSVETRRHVARVHYVYEIALRSGRRVASGEIRAMCMVEL